MVRVLYGASIKLDVACEDALHDHASLVLSGGAKVKAHLLAWRSLQNPLSADDIEVLQKKIFKSAVGAQANIKPHFFEVYGDWIRDDEVLGSQADAPILLFNPLIEERHEAGLTWLREVISAQHALFKNGFNRASLQDFKRRVGIAYEEEVNADKPSELIVEIGELLGFTPAKQPDAEDEPSS